MTLQNSSIRKKSKIGSYVLLFFILLFTLEIVSYLFLVKYAYVTIYIKLLTAIMFIYSFISFYKWSKPDKIYFYIFLLFIVKLVIESIVNFGSLLAYPSVLAVIFPVLYILVIKNIFKNTAINILHVLCKTIILFYIIFMLFNIGDFGFNITSNVFMENMDEIGPYSGDARILHARTIFLIMLPYLFYLSKSLKKPSISNLLILFFLILIILLHQHRTVWVTTIISTFLFVSINNKLHRKIFLVGIIITIAIIAAFLFIPNLLDLFIDRFQDILDPFNEDNTSGWRYLQILSYIEYVIQKPILGWGMNGFNLPNPFIDFWEEGTGHHFHDAYIEIIFYFGIVGLFLKYYPLYKITKYMSLKKLSDNTRVLIVFCVSGLVFSFSYVPPLTFWGIVGVCLLYLEKDLKFIKNNAQ
jgi:O-antigen ligase